MYEWWIIYQESERRLGTLIFRTVTLEEQIWKKITPASHSMWKIHFYIILYSIKLDCTTHNISLQNIFTVLYRTWFHSYKNHEEKNRFIKLIFLCCLNFFISYCPSKNLEYVYLIPLLRSETFVKIKSQLFHVDQAFASKQWISVCVFNDVFLLTSVSRLTS